jgi:hypothetical protein
MVNRITRGFSRLGIGAGVATVLCGAGLTSIFAADQYERLTRAALVAAPSMFDDLIPPPIVVAGKSAAIGLGVTLLLAFAAYGFFRGLGWIIAGFARD